MENNAQDKSKLVDQYDKLASKFNDLYLSGKERGREAMPEALDKSHEQLAKYLDYRGIYTAKF